MDPAFRLSTSALATGRTVAKRALLSIFLSCTAASASAALLPADNAERDCWTSYTRERTQTNLKELTSVDFSNLRTGYTVSSPVLVEFAVRGMGVVPAGKQLKGTGHHHILVDARLPASISDTIPFNDKHKHFGKGQTSTLLDLPAGRHTLRLLFADHEHRPYFVFSPEIAIEVLGRRSDTPRPKIDPKNFNASCAAWYQDEISRPRPPDEPLYVSNLRAGEAVTSPFNVRLGVDGFGICAAGQSAEKSGHFMLELLTRSGRKSVQSIDLSNGATQTNLAAATGAYILRLRFVDPATGNDLLRPNELPIEVKGQERL
jgi:hypothetical protein